MSDGDPDDAPPEPHEGPRTGAMTSAEVTAMRHGELDDAPLRSRYALEGKLGRGGMGVVVEAQDRRIGRRVAIKRLAGPPTAQAVDRFVREARVQGRLDHPAVVPVYDLGIQSDGRPYFAMRRLAGVTLGEVLHRQAAGEADAIARYPRRRLLEALVGVCLAIEYAHTRGVIHRDLKPANVVLGDYGEVHVLDWGVACMFDEPGEVVGAGTTGYMAPEQEAGEAGLDGRADVFSLGRILEQILGKAADRDGAVDLELICGRATAPARADRFASARELADSLERHLDADRDVAAQLASAADYAVRARGALDALGDADDDDTRASAMRDAGRALALDPGNVAAAAVVRSLLLDPPRRLPAAVVARLAADDADSVRANARTSAFAYLAVAAFAPLYLLQGVLDWRFVPALVALCALLAAVMGAASRGRMLGSFVWCSVIGGSAILILHSRVLGPFLVPPAIAALVAMAVMTHPTFRAWWFVMGCLGLSPVIAWILEETGVLASTVETSGSGLALGSKVLALPGEHLVVGMTLYVVALLAVAVGFARNVSTVHHATRRRLAVQAWHLRRVLGGDPT